MSVASFVAAQRTEFGVPHALTCRALELSRVVVLQVAQSTSDAGVSSAGLMLDAAVKRSFDASGGSYGSPRVLADLRRRWLAGVEEECRGVDGPPGSVARPTRTRRGWLTRPDKAAPPAPDLVKRDFTAPAINHKWCGDLTEVPTDEGKLYLATVEDLASKRIVGFGLSEHHDAELATARVEDGRSDTRR